MQILCITSWILTDLSIRQGWEFRNQSEKVNDEKDRGQIMKSNKQTGMCVFCNPNNNRVIDGNLAYVLIDTHPVSKYHSLVIPKRHFSSFFDISEQELAEIKHLLALRKAEILKEDPSVEGFNIGINDGLVAGQSIFHLHVHLIPRRCGDLENPRGGVRGVIPEKRNY